MVQENPLQRLTIREFEILKLIAEGYTNTYIKNIMFLAQRTVGRNINSIFSKLEVGKNKDISPRVATTLIYLKYKELD